MATNQIINGSLTVTQGITGSLFGTASYATTASYVEGGIIPSTALSDLGFTIIPNSSSVLNQNVTLPENCTVTYPSPLNMGSGYTISVPTSTTFTLI